MLSKWLCSSSPTLATLFSLVLAFACSGSDKPDIAVATAGSGAAPSGGVTGSAGTASSGGTTAVGGMLGTAGESRGGSTAPAEAGAANVAGNSAVAAGGGTSNTAGASGGTDASSTVPASDTFDGTTLDASWTVFRPDLADISVADGSLSIVPHSGALWYQASQADLVYKLVTGNFKATTTVHARKASNRAQTPAQFADVGGIMARNPSGSSENYILGVVGYAEMNQLAVEHKSTTNSKSVYGEVAFTPDAEFRLCRQGSTFTIYYRHIGDATWGPAFEPFERPDLPTTLQVGAIAYTGASAPDFVAIFDHFTFEPVGAGCTQ